MGDPHVCILGAGGLGCVVGGWLAESGVRVSLVARPSHVEAIRSQGLEVCGIRGRRIVRDRLTAATSAAEVGGPVDVLVVCVKAHDTGEALAAGELRQRTALALSLQNSVEKDQVLVDWIGADKVIGASTTEAGTLEGPGRVRHVATAPTAFYFGELDGTSSARVADLVALFDKAGFASRQSPEIQHVEWEKLLQISVLAAWSVSSTGMLPGGSVAEALVVREAAQHYVAIAKELLQIYCAMGYEPRDFYHPFSRFRELAAASFEEATEIMLEQGRRMLDQGIVGRPSLHVDLIRGRRTEVEQCLGAFLREAGHHEVEVPTARAAYRIIRTLEQLLV